MHHLHTLTGVTAVLVVCALLFLEECGIPMPMCPGDIVLVTAGSMAAMGSTSLWIVMPLAYLACLAGAITCYTLSRRAGRPVELAVGRRAGLTHERLLTAENRLSDAGARAVFVARIVPGVRIYASVASGCLRLSRRTFISGVAPGLALWLTWCTMLGYFLGSSVGMVLRWWDRAMVAGALLMVVTVLARWTLTRRRERPEASDQGAIGATA